MAEIKVISLDKNNVIYTPALDVNMPSSISELNAERYIEIVLNSSDDMATKKANLVNLLKACIKKEKNIISRDTTKDNLYKINECIYQMLSNGDIEVSNIKDVIVKLMKCVGLDNNDLDDYYKKLLMLTYKGLSLHQVSPYTIYLLDNICNNFTTDKCTEYMVQLKLYAEIMPENDTSAVNIITNLLNNMV